MDKDPAYEGVDVLILYAWSSVASSTSKFNFGIAWILSGAGSVKIESLRLTSYEELSVDNQDVFLYSPMSVSVHGLQMV
jgi:hypothetical protein